MKKKEKNLKGVDEELYQNVSQGNLILFAIHLVSEKEEKCVFERLLKECFSLFPKIFSFPRFPDWPDSRKIDSSLRKLRKKKLIIGGPKTFFFLTSSGKKTAEETAKIFRQRKLRI
ncbi:MAG: hypothetical protein FJZ07_02280 [Candidatus Nealsonbacteria bacterium]|nr:hypothetical protein [Candidatus Nealsonbacteria bacterium]